MHYVLEYKNLQKLDIRTQVINTLYIKKRKRIVWFGSSQDRRFQLFKKTTHSFLARSPVIPAV